MSACQTSPRTTALARARDSRQDRRLVSDLTSQLEKNLLPVLFVAAVVVAAVTAYFVDKDYAKVAIELKWNEFFQNALLAGVLFAGVLCATAWITAHCYMMADQFYRMVLLGLFVGIALCVGFSLWLFFTRPDNRTMAAWLMAVAVVGALVHTYICFKTAYLTGLVGMAPLLVTGIYLLWRIFSVVY